MDRTLRSIIDKKLIERGQSKAFQRLLNEHDQISNSTYLYSLFQIEFKKLTRHYYSTFTTQLDFGDEKPAPDQQIRINDELSRYLSGLKDCGLINEILFQDFINRIIRGEFVHKLQLLSAAGEAVALQEYMDPEKLKVFASELKSKNIVSSDYDKLVLDIEKRTLQHGFDFLNYCDKAVIIREQDYPDEPEEYLELIHKKTASIVPELSFSEFEFQVVLDSAISDSDSKFYNFVVSMKSNEKRYKQKSFYQLHSLGQNQYYGNKIDQQEYYKIFNKILSDLGSPYRFHQVRTHIESSIALNNVVDQKVFGIMALTEEQADLLQGLFAYIIPSHESFKELNSSKIESSIEEYKNIGLFSHLTSDQIEFARERVSEQDNNILNSVLMAFPDIIYTFDTELGELDEPYAKLIRELRRISHHDFNATDISDDFDIEKKERVVLKFKMGAKEYSRMFKIENDWIDVDFFDFVTSVVAENKLKGKFYQLYSGGQEVSMIYLTKEQHDYLRSHKLLLFADQSPEEE